MTARLENDISLNPAFSRTSGFFFFDECTDEHHLYDIGMHRFRGQFHTDVNGFSGIKPIPKCCFFVSANSADADGVKKQIPVVISNR
ncbi:MAG: hypothetical protein KDA85_01165 [Planctomycetaceae bacterium]|nr:hypothetical protein [Planctomycetaceae bacterium]